MNMMKVYQTYILLILSLLMCQPAAAQTTPATHAESMSKVWKGMNVDDYVGNDAYATNGKKFYLYNVGTGRFVIEGDWADEDKLMELFLENDADVDDIQVDDGSAEIIAPPDAFAKIVAIFEAKGITPTESSIAMVPDTMTEVT